METQNEFVSNLKAGFPILYINTFEDDRAIKNYMQEVGGYNCYVWDCVNYFRNLRKQEAWEIEDAFEALVKCGTLPQDSIIFLKNFHRFFSDFQIIQKLKNLAPLFKTSYRHIVILAPVIEIPIELEKEVQVLDFALPTIEELEELANKIATDNELDIKIDKESVEAAKGLTLFEAENTFSKSLITKKTYDRKIIETSKLQTVKKSGLMEIYAPVPIDSIGGLDPLKAYIISRKRGFLDDNLPTPHGILLAGLPGSGKSLTAKATASILEMPLLRLDLGTLKGSLVGESEKNMKLATNMIDAIAPCVVWLDEIEKALAGVASSGKTDGGTGANMFGQLLTWMQESTAQKYIVATCNDIDDLFALSQGALIRRFDDVFFVDLPTKNERKKILEIMIKKYKAENLDFSKVDMNQWTGAEIEKFVINALYDGVEIAANNIRPIAVQNSEKINKAREWAKYNAILANEQEITAKAGTRTLKIN